MMRQDRQGTTPETAEAERCDQRSRINPAIGCDRLDRRLQEVRDGLTSSRPIVILGWITVAIMGLAAVLMLTLARVSTSTGRD
jgi:hypothetical protein